MKTSVLGNDTRHNSTFALWCFFFIALKRNVTTRRNLLVTLLNNSPDSTVLVLTQAGRSGKTEGFTGAASILERHLVEG